MRNVVSSPVFYTGCMFCFAVILDIMWDCEAPVDTPVDEPLNAPRQAPVDSPVDTPRQGPVDAPVDAPVESPDNEAVDAPRQAPVDATIALKFNQLRALEDDRLTRDGNCLIRC